MRLTRLRIVGFKTFVEPTDFLIEPGLTGVVGPNGCGKSNLVEALRWVMGENSHKNMRASGMDDVIFSGSGARPARNTAEVMLTLDNDDRRRRRPSTIGTSSKWRGGSSARKARPTGSTGARSAPATCRSSSPMPRPAPARRPSSGRARSTRSLRRSPRPAGGSWRTPPASPGLHARRHEAELRLKAAEDNLLRVEDVLREIEAQIDSLKKQGRQANRYKNLSAEIRPARGAAIRHRPRGGARAGGAAGRQAQDDLDAGAADARTDAATATAQAVAAHALPALREAEAARAAALQRLTIARNELEARGAALQGAPRGTRAAYADLDRDIAREASQRADAEATIARLSRRDRNRRGDGGGDEAVGPVPRRAQGAGAELGRGRGAARCAPSAGLRSQRPPARRSNAPREEAERAARFTAEKAKIERDLGDLATLGRRRSPPRHSRRRSHAMPALGRDTPRRRR